MRKSSVDVAVIGGGTAGLVAAAGTAALGARTILIERNRLGGECTWTGCVPSKTLLHIANQAQTVRNAASAGVHAGELRIDFRTVMESVRATRQGIYEHGESPDRLKHLGIQPLQARARFLDGHTLRIEREGRQRDISFRSAIVATGSRPFIPEIPGLETVDFLTTDTLFEINELPQRLTILGGGPAGVEMAQAFARLGSTVTLVCRDAQLLAGMDQDAAELLEDRLKVEGISIYLRSTLSNVQQRTGELELTVAGDGEPFTMHADRLLIATGRIANTTGAGLEAAGIEYEREGIPVDSYCRTSVRHILASGDVTTAPNMTHVAEEMSKAAAINALARLPLVKFEQDVIPAVVYTDPEVATVGRSERELDENGLDYDRIDLPFDRIDRAVVEGNGQGFIRVLHRRGRVLGATIVGVSAGELIVEYALAMSNGLRLHELAGTVHPYPTMMLGARRAADQFYFQSLQRWMVRGFQLAYGYHGRIPEYIGTPTIV